MNCPSCGADIDVDKRYAHLVVCAYCDSTILLDKKVARISGKMAALAKPRGPLYVGGSGRVGPRGFSVLGRVRYAYSNGFWDEWYLKLDDGKTAWISEDENNFTLEILRNKGKTPDYATTQPGDTVTIGGINYHVDERDVAECEGGEGQLPFRVMTGERIPFLDLSTGENFATVEYELDGSVRLFIGKRLDPKDLQVDTPAAGADTLAVERAADETSRERVVRSDRRSMTIRCEACAHPLDVPPDGQTTAQCGSCGHEIDLTQRFVECPTCHLSSPVRSTNEAKMLTCAGCRQMLDITRAEPSPIGSLVSRRPPKVPVKLGQPFRFRGEEFRVVGHVRYIQREFSDFWRSDEFLLYSKKAGYHWLILEDGHFSIATELDERPTSFDPRTAERKQTIQFDGRTWKVFERCDNNYVLEWVDGELTWVAQVGDTYSFLDATSPPHLLSAEWTKSEMEWYTAEYVEPTEVAKGLGLDPQKLPPRHGVAPHQPYKVSPFFRQSAMVMAGFAALFVVLGLNSWMKNGKRIADIQIAANSYEDEYLTRSFTVSEADTLCKARVRAPVDNSWVYFDMALIDEQDQALLDFSTQVSYYHGYDDGHWSEGSHESTKVFKIAEPGEYRLLIQGQYGDGPAHGATISIYENVAISRYYLVMLVICVVWAGLAVVRRLAFEGQRWHEDDDDDDDD